MLNIEHGCTVLLNKPLDWTSFDVVNKIRYALRSAFDVRKIKVGHAGTLDPKASGLLILCIGRHTKKIDSFQRFRKEYIGSFKLGETTPTYDSETEPNAFFDTRHINQDLLEEHRIKFVGDVEQVPPIYSALKVDGVKAYKAARSGKEVKMKKREIKIYDFEISKIQIPKVEFRVVCSKGTYIRSLAYDFGKSLNSGAYLSSLCRTRIGPFRLENAWTIERFIHLIERSK